MKGFKVYGLLAAFAVVAAIAGAQDGPPPQGGGGYGGRPGMEQGPGRRMGPPPLFLRPDVQKELKLTDEQIEKLKSMMPPPPGARGGGGRGEGGPREGGRQQGSARAGGGVGPQQGNREIERRGGPPDGGRMDEQLAQVLSDSQLKRLKELRLQEMGAQALGRKELADKVGLSDEDRMRIRGMVEEAMESMPRPEPGERPDPEAMHRAHEAMRAELNQRILSSLTSGQRAKWEALCGKPFKFDTNWRPPQPPMQDGPPPPAGGGFGGGQ